MSEVELLPWSVAVGGRWNASILTPLNIGKRLLGIPEGQPLQVEVPVNIAGPPRVRHEGISVQVEESRLFIEVERGNYAALGRALDAARAAIKFLPFTPFAGAGVMVTFSLSEVISEPPSATNRKWDDQITCGGHEIVRHMAGRAIKWGEARVYIVVDRAEDGSGMAAVNFERRSDNSDQLTGFLGNAHGEFQSYVEKMIHCLREGGIS